MAEATTRDEPQWPLRRSCKNLRTLSGELKAAGHAISHVAVRHLVKAEGDSLQANAKVHQGQPAS